MRWQRISEATTRTRAENLLTVDVQIPPVPEN